MSMHDPLCGDYPMPDEPRRVAQAALPTGTVDLQLRDRFGMLVDNQRFAHRFAHAGQPAIAPARVALVLIFPFIADLSDRAAADAVRDRSSWTDALGLPLDDPGCDYSVLSALRQRLRRDDAAARFVDTVLHRCREVGLLKTRSKQRTDSTYVLATMRDRSRLENVGETLRHAHGAFAVAAPAWRRTHATPAWVERYSKRLTDYRLPQAAAERAALVATSGPDGYHLLEAIDDPATPPGVRVLPAVETLRQGWVQPYDRCTDPAAPVVRWRTKDEQPPAAPIIRSPYDPQARYTRKRDTTWLGSTVHLTETCEDDTPTLITQVTPTPPVRMILRCLRRSRPT